MKPLLALALFSSLLLGRDLSPLPNDPHFADYQLDRAPAPSGLMLTKGDKLAICGDSITEQKQYSRIIEAYLTACVPELEITCRQFGWGGERADGFHNRMMSDVIRFKPDIATTCYGMNDFRYVPFDQSIEDYYQKSQNAVTETFLKNDCKVIIGSPGIIDSVPHWVQSAKGTQKDLNLALARFRNLDIKIAAEHKVGFADVYRPMLIADWRAKKAHGSEFKIAGKDGVHPGWAGHLIMAHAFLKSLGLDGDLGTITIQDGKATATQGHDVKSYADGTLTLVSHKLPFSSGPGDIANDNSLIAGFQLVPFHRDLNRLTLIIKDPTAPRYLITWGKETHEYDAAALKTGINLAADFIDHPLHAPFRKIWDATGRKQKYETRQMKELMHGPEGRIDLAATVALTEKVHLKLANELSAARQPAEHQITIKPLK